MKQKPIHKFPEKLVVDALVTWCPRISGAEKASPYNDEKNYYYRCNVELPNGNNFNGHAEMQGEAILEGLVLAHKKILALTRKKPGAKKKCGDAVCEETCDKPPKKLKRAVIKKAIKTKQQENK